MTTPMKKLSLLAAALLCLASCAIGAEGEQASDRYDSQLLQPGATAPDFTITNAQHPGGLSLSSLRGKYVVLEFWASWCPDCRRATPAMVAMHEEYAPLGVEFIGISFDTDSAAWQRYIEANGMAWTHYSELKAWKHGTTLDGPYRVNWIPTIYLIGPDGKIAAASISADRISQALAALKPALAAGAGATAATGEGRP